MRVFGLGCGQRQALKHLVGCVIRGKDGTCKLALQKGGTVRGRKARLLLGTSMSQLDGSMGNPEQGLEQSVLGLGE